MELTIKVTRTAFYLESQQQSLFAWLHRCDSVYPQRKHGVIICSPLGAEQVHSHRGLRHLADALAQEGLTVLRFDYHGTGDSAGIDENPDRYPTWLANIRDAMPWLRQHLGCSQISLIGLRLGASLAMQAAAEQAIDNLVLWMPVVKGRMYVREMKALSLIAETKPQPTTDAPDDVEAAGFVMTKQTADALSKLDLLAITPKCQRVLIVLRDDMPTDTRLLEHLSAVGVNPEQIAVSGYADMMAEPHYTQVPKLAIAAIVNWFLARLRPVTDHEVRVNIENAMMEEAILPHEQYTHVPADPQLKIRERILGISQEPHLFGILSEPEHGEFRDLPLILLVNAGSAYHIGCSRLYVFLCRQLASQGFRCVRMDLCGLGDSVTTDIANENDSYAATMFRDIDLALNYLKSYLDVKRVVLMGLCSGAYAAFQSAVQMANPSLVESVLINPLTFYWREGMTLESSPAKQHSVFHYYMTSALRPSKWLKMLLGNSKIGIFGAIKLIIERWRLKKHESQAETAAAGLGHPERENLPADLQRIADAGRHVTCFFSEDDPGYDILTFHARRKVRQLLRDGKLDAFFVQSADHTFSQRRPRREVVRMVTEHFLRRYRQ